MLRAGKAIPRKIMHNVIGYKNEEVIPTAPNFMKTSPFVYGLVDCCSFKQTLVADFKFVLANDPTVVGRKKKN